MTEHTGEIASTQPVPAFTLDEYEQAINGILDEMAELVPDGEPEDAATKAQRERFELLLTDLISRERDKVDRMAAILQRFEATVEYCRREAARLKQRAQLFENKRARLADYIIEVMSRSNLKRLEGVSSTLTRIQNPQRVEVDDPQSLPFEFQRWAFGFTPTTRGQLEQLRTLALSMAECIATCEPDKVALKDAAAVPEGVHILPGSWRLARR